MRITSHAIHRVHLRLPEPIGDSQVRFQDHYVTVLELGTDSGIDGVGFDLQQGTPIPPLQQLVELFRLTAWPGLDKASPFAAALRITRPRGGNVGAGLFGLPVITALWDIMAKSQGLPLFRFLGGTEPRVRAYGSTLDFHLSDEQFRRKLQRLRSRGFDSVKVKIGHPDPAWDLRRLAIVREVMGGEARLMVDANEAWNVKEAMIRLSSYRESGFTPFWVEDPITREDYQGYAELRRALPFTRINTGEYLGFSGKRRLLEAGAVDVLQLGEIPTARETALLAGDYGVCVALGNTLLEIGVHLAASLPECLCMEYSDLMWNELARESVKVEGGYAYAPERPGHGIEIDRDALKRYAEP